jgi:hypothetical protein
MFAGLPLHEAKPPKNRKNQLKSAKLIPPAFSS